MLLDAWLASSPARVAIWARTTVCAQPYTCHHLDWGNSNVILCVVTSRTAKSSTQGATQHVMHCETPPGKASIGCNKVHHLCDIAHREWHPPYCYAKHVLAGETLPPTNVHSTFMPQAGATIVLLNLHAWNYPSEPSTALTKSLGDPATCSLRRCVNHPIS